uniref:Hsp70 family protein n=1 Tax=unclassified Variovorax TaxID=663243 RepID=UPI000D3D448F
MTTPATRKIFGIDLGTTYSCVSCINEYGVPTTIRDHASGEFLTPSVVYFDPDHDPSNPDESPTVVGSFAKEVAKIAPERVAKVVKRHMHDQDWYFEVDGRKYDPAFISARILRHLATEAAKSIGEPVTDVVITVPAYFGTYERERTVEAGRIAGLVVHGVLPEPMAAALHYGLDEVDTGKTVLVFDLGGGTFDVTVMAFSAQSKESLATKGDHDLGGFLWDSALARYWAEQIAQKNGTDLDSLWKDGQVREGLMLEAEKVKKSLTGASATKAMLSHDGTTYTLPMDRKTFDSITEHLLSRCELLVDQALAVARDKRPGLAIDTVLLVGGSTLMPQVRERLLRKFGAAMTMRQTEPHLAVSLGAANYAYQMQVKAYLKEMVELTADRNGYSARSLDELPEAERSRILAETAVQFGRPADAIADIIAPTFVDVSPRSFGVKHLIAGRADEMFTTNLVRVQQPMPASGAKVFGTVQDKQASVRIVCVENERDLGVDDDAVPFDPDEVIGEVELRLNGTLPANAPVEMAIDFDATGRVRVRGKDLTHGNEIQGEFTSRGLRTPEQLLAAQGEMNQLAGVALMGRH